MRRNWFIAAVVIGIAAIVVAAIAMRLSDDGPQTTEEWAGSVCTSLSDWRDSITALADVGGEPLTADTLRDKLGDAEDATSELVTQLHDLGPPDLESADALEQQLDESTTELESSFDALRDSAEAAADAPPASSCSSSPALAPTSPPSYGDLDRRCRRCRTRTSRRSRRPSSSRRSPTRPRASRCKRQG